MISVRFADDVAIAEESGKVTVSLGDTSTAIATVTNTSHSQMGETVVRVEGDGMMHAVTMKTVEDLEEGDSTEVEIECKALRKGDRVLFVSVDLSCLLFRTKV